MKGFCPRHPRNTSFVGKRGLCLECQRLKAQHMRQKRAESADDIFATIAPGARAPWFD